mmetsp:Transcript_20374/g.28122  ORF Transcript_20374/g.28122 Transcript_20374/m.28122 type:complete len:453 (+) Transcript_20374:2-1360(+)
MSGDDEMPGDDEIPEPEPEPPRTAHGYIFDQAQLRDYHIKLSGENLRRLDQNPRKEEYVKGALEFEDQVIWNVGVRYKGSYGSFRHCVEGFPNYGKKTCTKLSMVVKINYLDKHSERRFFGLKKLQFHSMNQDKSLMKERLGYYIFRELGVASSHVVHARVFLNRKFVGVFALVEKVDRSFVKMNPLFSPVGNLLKDIWPFHFDHGTTSQRSLLNSGVFLDDSRKSRLHDFAVGLRRKSKNQRPSFVADYMNMTYIMSYIVGDRAIRHNDGPLTNFREFHHNFYWYEDFSSNLLYIVPWDLDDCLPTKNRVFFNWVIDEWGENSRHCSTFGARSYDNPGYYFCGKASVCDVLMEAWVPFEDEFLDAGNRLLTGPYASGHVESLIEQWSDQIKDSVLQAHRDYPHDFSSISNDKWKKAVKDVLKAVTDRRRYFKKRIWGQGNFSDHHGNVHGC